MVSFQCDACADTVKKPKLDQHRNRCYASFTCLDCSTTFNSPAEYKSHTSCVSEAQKYQGALYKGDKGKKQHQANGQFEPPQATSSTASPAPAPAPAPAAPAADASSSIHPSRLNQMNAGPAPTYGQGHGVTRGGGYMGRGGRGGRGGFQASGGRGGGQGGYGDKSYATSENRLGPQNGMRSWGSPATTPMPEAGAGAGAGAEAQGQEQAQGAHGNVAVGGGAAAAADKKKNKKKGDKGGTGSKANSKNKPTEGGLAQPQAQAQTQVAVPLALAPAPAPASADEPKTKKRKLDEAPESEPQPAPTTPAEVNPKTLKKLRKKLGKLEEKSATANPVTLGEWIESLGKDKDAEKKVDAAEILRSLKVSHKDGSFVLSL
ncbi:hypothetical protein IAU60_002269 [Kwoniella sp. DSM 27419]